MVYTFKHFRPILLPLRLFRLETIESPAQGEGDLGVFGLDAGDGAEVGRLNIAHVARRAEDIAENERGRQPSVEQLLADGYIRVPVGIRAPLGSYRRADEASIYLDAGIFRHVEEVVPEDIVVRTRRGVAAGGAFVLHFIMVEAPVYGRVPPADGVEVQAQFETRGIVVADVRHRVEGYSRFVGDAQALDFVLSRAVEGRNRYGVLPKRLAVVQFEGVDILRADVGVANLGGVEVAVGDVRLHVVELGPCRPAGIGGEQAMVVRQRIAHVYGREEFEPVLRTVRAGHGATQYGMSMLATDTDLGI